MVICNVKPIKFVAKTDVGKDNEEMYAQITPQYISGETYLHNLVYSSHLGNHCNQMENVLNDSFKH